MNLRLSQIQDWLPGSRLIGDPNLSIARVHTDSRSVQADDLFVGQNIPPVAQQFASRAEDELGFFAVTWGQKKHAETSRAVSPCGGKRQCRSRSGQLLAILQTGIVELSACRGDM
jgi:hypothetical protein